ncbi:MAG TPA: S46 family peptidase [Gemmatimonadaceae bacterium]|nr:S46 family peptidase [Gemmatimonadaceae bacterium]
MFSRADRLLAALAAAVVTAAASACASAPGATTTTAPSPAAAAPAAADGGAPAAISPASPIKEFGTMWTFDAPPLEYWKARYNFTPDQAWLDHVRLASVRIPGCSASIVSRNGLVMTNHHCGRECTAEVSPKDSNYITTGFAAKAVTEEKKCPMLWADQLQSIEDVTAKVRAAVTATTPAAQVEQRTAAIARIEQECKQQTSLNCQVVTFYQGGMYSLYRYKRFNDVRLVMAPEGDIAFYGGDPDNFTYPRYDLDLTLLRIYENDKPLQAKDYLKWSANGAQENDLVFVTGNPGSTGRLATVAQMEYLRDVQYPAQLAAYDRQLAIYHELSAKSPEAARQYQNQIFGLANSKKAVTGYRAGLLDSTIMAKKRAFESDFRRRVAADPALQTRYGSAWEEIAGAQRELASFATQARYYGFNFGGSTLMQVANLLAALPGEAAMPDSARLAQFRGPGLERSRTALAGPIEIDPEFEKAIIAAQLRAAQQELPANDPFLQAALGGRSPEVAAEAIVAGTKLGTPEGRKALLDGGAAAVASSTDPAIVLARRVYALNRPLALRTARLNAVASANAERVGQALFAAYGKTLPPDATFTLRITDGVVKGYPMNGTLAPYKTTFYGLYDRANSFDDKGDFKLPPRWLAKKDRLDLTTPFDFVSTNDIIGGNSGSPVINRNAEVVGLIFDGNIESLPNRFIFTDDVARSVSVSSRAITEALRKMYDAPKVADELEGK